MSLVRDFRLAWRHLRRAPGHALTAALTLALAVGANSAIFSAVHAVLLRPLPVQQPDALAVIWQTDAGGRAVPNGPGVAVLNSAVREHGRARRPPARRSSHRGGARAKDGPLLRRRPRTERRGDERSARLAETALYLFHVHAFVTAGLKTRAL
jgi:hypothetical protein